jgi:hypothetical protein
MTREEARQVEQQLTKRHPGDTVEVTRVPAGVWVEARNKGGWTFLHVADDSPLLTLLGAYPETEPEELPGPDRRSHLTLLLTVPAGGMLAVGIWPGWLWHAAAFPDPVAQTGEHLVGAVYLVAYVGEVGAEGAEVGSAGDRVFHEPGGLRPIRVHGARIVA